MTILALASFTLREAVRKKALLGAIILTLGFLALYATGVFFAVREFQGSAHAASQFKTAAVAGLLLAGMYVINSIGGLLAIFTAAGSISGEVDQGTLHAVIPRPVIRRQVILGKWLGLAAILVAYVSITAFGAIGIVWLIGRYVPSGAILGVTLMALGTLLLLSLSLAGSTVLPTIANGIVIFLLYSVGTLGGMIEQLGWMISNRTMVNIGIITSLMIPTDSVWKMAAQVLQPSLPMGVLSAGAGPFATLNPPSIWMAIYAAFYGLAALATAILLFERRDL